MRSRSAFSLVELSIVLVILGLLTGGILAGQSLIRASQLRAVSTEYTRYVTAIQSFRGKYFQLPGDFDSATRFWLKDSAPTTCTTNSSASGSASGACDGNGDGTIACGSNAINVGTESFQVWRHLSLAGLIEGTYTGATGATADCNYALVSTNIPTSKWQQGAWGHISNTYSSLPPTSVTTTFTLPGGYPTNMLLFGTSRVNGPADSPILTPEDAWNIDTKLDDGKPGQGSILTRSGGSAFGSASSCSTGADTNDLGASYRLTNTAVSCALIFLRAF